MGGPKIALSVQNVGSATGVDSTLATDVALNWASGNVGTAVTFDYDAGGSLIPFVQQDKIFSIDAGAGVGSFQGEDYFWGFRGIYPQNYLMQGCVYLKAKNPSYKNVSIVYYTGGQYTGLNTDIQSQIQSAGFTVVGNANTQQGSTDFSGAIATLRSQNPDIVVLGSSGNDAAYFLKDYQVSGMTAPVVGDSFSGPQAIVGGAAFNGTYVVQENFLPDNPSNEWGKIFVKHYRAAYGNQGSSQANSPLNLSASYYNVAFVLWELARRVLQKGGNINDGEQIQAALLENLSFPTIFGGKGTHPGRVTFDTTTHGLAHEPIGIFEVVNGSLKLVGSADSHGGPVTVVA
jgi:ABC-type branched-subunit amino acid transport system substrate-binding protein